MHLPKVLRRDSAKATALAAVLDEAGVVGFDGRRLEGISRDGLLPLGEVDEETVVRYCRELAALGYGTGKSADRAARVMLTRGLPCRRTRSAILRGLDLNAEALLEGTFEPGTFFPLLKDGMAALDLDSAGLAAEAAGAMHEAPKQTLAQRWAFRWLDSISTSSPSGRFDYAGAMIAPPGEPAEEHHESHIRTVLEAAFGKEVTDPCIWVELKKELGTRGKYAPAGMSVDETDEAQRWFSIVPRTLPRGLGLAAEAPPILLIVAAQMIRPAVGLVAHFGDEDADDLAACIAPFVLAALESGAMIGIDGLASMAEQLVRRLPDGEI